MPGVGATVGSALAASCEAGAVAASGFCASCAKPAGGADAGWAAAVVVAGELAGACCAAAGVSQIAANAIAHPIRFIRSPGNVVETGNAGLRRRSWPLYRRGFPEPQAPDPRCPTRGVEGGWRGA